MAIGRCQFMTCVSLLGQGCRGDYMAGGSLHFTQVFLCSEHQGWVADCRKAGFVLILSPDNVVYPEIWLQALSGRA